MKVKFINMRMRMSPPIIVTEKDRMWWDIVVGLDNGSELLLFHRNLNSPTPSKLDGVYKLGIIKVVGELTGLMRREMEAFEYRTSSYTHQQSSTIARAHLQGSDGKTSYRILGRSCLREIYGDAPEYHILNTFYRVTWSYPTHWQVDGMP